MTIQPILITMSKNEANGFSYSVPSSTMLSEALKFVISSALLVRQRCSTPSLTLLHEGSCGEFMWFMVPALIYFVNNNCVFFILQAVDPTTFQLLSQMKTIFTGLLFRIFLNRQLSYVQWLALVTLACGTAVSQLPSHGKGGRHAHEGPPYLGMVLAILSSLLSALGGIYNEKLLKGRPTASLHWQNIQMYSWGVLFNAMGAYYKDGDNMRANGVLAGFTWQAWLVVVCNALNGLAISAVLKYADNIARVYAHAIAMMMTMAISVQLFGAPVTPQLILAVILVGTSTLQYNLPQDIGDVRSIRPSEDEKSNLLADESDDGTIDKPFLGSPTCKA